MDCFSELLKSCIAKGRFEYHPKCKNINLISFTNDLFILCGDTEDSMRMIKEVLEVFGDNSGLKPNLSKSSCYFAGKGMSFWGVTKRSMDSFILSKLLMLRDVIKPHVRYNIVNKAGMLFWHIWTSAVHLQPLGHLTFAIKSATDCNNISAIQKLPSDSVADLMEKVKWPRGWRCTVEVQMCQNSIPALLSTSKDELIRFGSSNHCTARVWDHIKIVNYPSSLLKIEMLPRVLSQLLSMYQRLLQGEWVTSRLSIKYTDQSEISLKDPAEVSLANILSAALEVDQVMTREAARQLMLAEEPSQHIDENFGKRTLENSSNCGSIPNTPNRDLQSKDGSSTGSADFLVPAMMTSIASLEEQMAALTRMVENMLQKVHHQDDSISQMSGKINDQEHTARAAEAALKQKEAPITSKMGDGMTYLFPLDTLSSSRGPTKNTLETSSFRQME
ncbi:hypothetical protein LIER_14785 [Lithospermum erythrorhizon]|uniref:Reverse transcriptase domain-containing protein n=1 Tax=Lithospermum erythrorhizon TaxID=34254 RepID=A0AAV3Q4H2_LITER